MHLKGYGRVICASPVEYTFFELRGRAVIAVSDSIFRTEVGRLPPLGAMVETLFSRRGCGVEQRTLFVEPILWQYTAPRRTGF